MGHIRAKSRIDVRDFMHISMIHSINRNNHFTNFDHLLAAIIGVHMMIPLYPLTH